MRFYLRVSLTGSCKNGCFSVSELPSEEVSRQAKGIFENYIGMHTVVEGV
jgi:hypothetical protein